jgi:hypothetical protein
MSARIRSIGDTRMDTGVGLPSSACRWWKEPTPAVYLHRGPDATLVDAGGRRVAARNPYWDRWGVTIVDPDGYRLVLSHRTWP